MFVLISPIFFQIKHYYYRNVTYPSDLFKQYLDIGKYRIEIYVYEGFPYETVRNHSISFEIFEYFGKPKLKGEKEKLA